MTSRYHGSKISGSQQQGAQARRRRRQRERQKRKTTTLHVHYVFLYISQPSLRDCEIKFLISGALFMEYVNAIQLLNFLFLFPNLDTVLSDLTPEKFAII